MSYQKKNMCHYCYGVGHNRRTCPKLRKEAEEGNGYAEEVLRRQNRREEAIVRNCSYCKTTGHNQKTCMVLQTDRIKIVTANKKFREEMFEKIQQHGIGVGMVFTYTAFSDTHVFFVDQLIWDNILVKNAKEAICVSVCGERTPYYDLVINGRFFEKIESGAIKIIEPSYMVGAGKPDKWESSQVNLDRIIPE